LDFCYGTTFRTVAVGIARLIHKRDERIASLEASIVSEACMRDAPDRVQTSMLECRITALEALITSLQVAK
jgi:hypothetical protein